MFELKSFLIVLEKLLILTVLRWSLHFSVALNTGSSILVKLLSFGAYSGILRDLVISLKCLLNTSAILLSSDTMSFCSISISFLACFTDLLEKKGSMVSKS